jgi:uncharacterized protein YecT (DUF1311 family)
MRIALTLIAAAALSGAAVSAWAGAQGEPSACNGGTYEMVDCLNAQRAHWDKELTIAYQRAMKSTTPQARTLLRDAERAWIKYRDANCAYYAAGEGTIASINAAACLRDMTQKRAQELSSGGAGPDSPGKEDRD